MSLGVVRAVDLVAVASGVVAATMAATYVGVIRSQGEQPLAWVLVVLVGGALAAMFGAPLRAPHRRLVLWTAGTVLILLGLLAILSIGLPILVAGALALVAGSRSTVPAQGRPAS
ncbi:MAG TPA: hypothetical protein VFG72_03045 [Marmoricola sp.]|nr:hypothetical protein [Marmoricola sp.]